MKLRQLLDDDNAVSPVIGVILMVAITVILAAVIATFVLGLGEQVSDTAPQASFTFDYESGATASTDVSSSTTGDLTIRHGGGATIQGVQLYIVGSNGRTSWKSVSSGGTEVSAGSSVTVGVSNSDTVQLVWENDEGTSSATLQEWEGPQA